MRTKYYRVVMLPVMPLGHYRSLPAEIGSAAPSYTPAHPRPLSHPQEMSLTVEAGLRPLEPLNGSTLATEGPPELPVGQAEKPPFEIVDA